MGTDVQVFSPATPTPPLSVAFVFPGETGGRRENGMIGNSLGKIALVKDPELSPMAHGHSFILVTYANHNNKESEMRTFTLFLLLLLIPFSNAQVGNNQGLINPNLAERDDLIKLPHVDENIADAIVNARPYLNATELNTVLSPLLDAEQRGELYGKLFRPLNLNTASEDEIQQIPGMSRRMVHEFEEYRPYTSMQQFRREIGKYVDGEEVARLEQYVFVPMNLNTAGARASFLLMKSTASTRVSKTRC